MPTPSERQALTPTFVRTRPLTREALAFGQEAHEGQRREADEAPFILHPLEAAWLLAASGFDDEVTAAAVLHDVLEETGVACEDIEDRFSARVAAIVAALTEDEGIEDQSERKAHLREAVDRAGAEPAAVFAADKVSKVRELRIRLSRDPGFVAEPSARAKLDHYRHSLGMVEDRLGDHRLVQELEFELQMLEALPPRGLERTWPVRK